MLFDFKAILKNIVKGTRLRPAIPSPSKGRGSVGARPEEALGKHSHGAQVFMRVLGGKVFALVALPVVLASISSCSYVEERYNKDLNSTTPGIIYISKHTNGAFRYIIIDSLSTSVTKQLAQEGDYDINKIRMFIKRYPWVKEVECTQDYPSMDVTARITEREPYARWGDGYEILDTDGKIFLGHFPEDPDHLGKEIRRFVYGPRKGHIIPTLYGPTESIEDIMDEYENLSRILKRKNLEIGLLMYSYTRSWVLMLDNGLLIKLGSGDVRDRLNMLMDIWDDIVWPRLKNIEYIDLRYRYNAMAIGRKKEGVDIGRIYLDLIQEYKSELQNNDRENFDAPLYSELFTQGSGLVRPYPFSTYEEPGSSGQDLSVGIIDTKEDLQRIEEVTMEKKSFEAQNRMYSDYLGEFADRVRKNGNAANGANAGGSQGVASNQRGAAARGQAPMDDSQARSKPGERRRAQTVDEKRAEIARLQQNIKNSKWEGPDPDSVFRSKKNEAATPGKLARDAAQKRAAMETGARRGSFGAPAMEDGRMGGSINQSQPMMGSNQTGGGGTDAPTLGEALAKARSDGSKVANGANGAGGTSPGNAIQTGSQRTSGNVKNPPPSSSDARKGVGAVAGAGGDANAKPNPAATPKGQAAQPMRGAAGRGQAASGNAQPPQNVSEKLRQIREETKRKAEQFKLKVD